MKPIELTLEAFGSYINRVTLNFEDGLHGEKIFLINGATGAGKTTILDAICYALYGAASGKDREGTMLRAKGVADNKATTVEFIFELDGKIYKVHRELTIHPNRKKNQVQKTAELYCDNQISETQDTNVTAKIKDLLGFDVKQFRQVVLLPQGEFTTFLFARAEDRQPILDTLFNAALYQRIQDGLEAKAAEFSEILKELNAQKTPLEAQLQGATVDGESLAKLAAQFDEAQKNSAELKKISDTALGEFTDGKKLSEAFNELAKRRTALENAQRTFEQAEKFLTAAQEEYDKRTAETATRQELQARAQKLESSKKLVDDLIAKREALPAAQQALHSAENQLRKLNADAENFAAWLAKYKRERDALSDADKNLETAKKLVDTLKHIADLERQLSAANMKVDIEQEKLDEARAELDRLQKLQLDGSAARLAKNLRDGEPCPVCGSRTHHHVDFGETDIPTDSDIKTAQINVEKYRKTLDAQKKSASSIEGQLISKRDELKNLPAVSSKAEAEKLLAKAIDDAKKLADYRHRIEEGEQRTEKNRAELEKANQQYVNATNNHTGISSALQQLEQQIPEEYSANPKKLATELIALQKNIRELEAAWNSADKNFRNAGNKKSESEGAFKSAQKVFRELADKLRDKTPPDIVELEEQALLARRNHEDAIRAEDALKHQFDSLKKLSAQIAALDEKISAAQKNFGLWQKLSEAASGKIPGKKISFVRYYLGSMFDEVLIEANYRLEKMSGRRYQLRQKDAGKRATSTAGLNLEIFDEFNGEARAVETLSGGERFLASLSLALGLAAVIRNNLGGINLDTIFIDEGFGSLDSETLDFAISTIAENSGGRLVGIISHIEELKTQIPVRLDVRKTKTGSTAEFVS